MSRRVEFFDAAGLRRDGRRANELRETSLSIGTGTKSASPAIAQQQTNDDGAGAAPPPSAAAASGASSALSNAGAASAGGGHADGYAELTSASTSVRALVFGPRQASLRDARPDSAHVTCEVTALRRRGGGAARRARSLELSALVIEAITPVLLLAQYPLSAIHIHVDVLQSDGDEEVCCINAASLALADACIAMRDVVVASQVCFLDGKHVVVDPTAEELRSGCPRWIEAVFAHNPRLLAMLHEEGRYARKDQLEDDAKDALHAACLGACSQAATAMLAAVREHTNAQLAVLEGK